MHALNLLKIAQALCAVVGISTGQLLLKLAAVNLSNGEIAGFWLVGQRINVYLIFGVLVLGCSTLLWVWVLRGIPLSLAYPVMALAFIIVPLLSHFFLGEALGWRLVLGSALIGLGLVAIYS